MSGRKSRQPVEFNKDAELKEWFRTYYVKWMETCDNQRWLTSGRGEKHPQCMLPFIPFGMVPSLPYCTLLNALIDDLVCRIPDQTVHSLGNPGYMASIIRDPGTSVRPYIMIECIAGGVVQEHILFRDMEWETAHDWFKLWRPQAAGAVIYKKTVTTGFLRRLCDVHQQWLVHGDNALYVIEFLLTLLDGIESGEARVDPPLPTIENLRRIMGQLGMNKIMTQVIARDPQAKGMPAATAGKPPERESVLGPLSRDFFRRLSPSLPDLVLQTRRGDIRIDLGSNRAVFIAEEALFAFLEGLRLHDSLAGITSHCFQLLERGLRCGWVKISGLTWVTRLSARWFEPRVRALSGKVQLLAKIMANPYRLAFLLGDKAALIEVRDGVLSSIDLEEIPPDLAPRAPLREQWLWLCRKRDFVHLAFALKDEPQSSGWALKPPGDLSFLRRIEFYPDNEFVRFILRKGPIQLFFNVIMPFLRA